MQNRHFIILHLEPEESINCLNNILSDMGLTPREVELVQPLDYQGLKNTVISANKLFISEYTVQNHLKAIYQKDESKKSFEFNLSMYPADI